MQIEDEKNHIPANALPLRGEVMGSGGKEYWAPPARGRGHGLGGKGTRQASLGFKEESLGFNGRALGKLGFNMAIYFGWKNVVEKMYCRGWHIPTPVAARGKLTRIEGSESCEGDNWNKKDELATCG